jgi:hypothetical protein
VLELMPLGWGVGWIDQIVPFQRSVSGTLFPPTEVDPTAVHAVADEHDTALRVPTAGEETTAQVAAAAAGARHRAHGTGAPNTATTTRRRNANGKRPVHRVMQR